MTQKDKNNTSNKETSFLFDYVHLDPKEQIGLHHQSTWELSYIIYGTGIRLIGDTNEPFKSGEVILIPPHISHCWYFDGNVTDHRGRIANITIKFDNDFLNRCAQCFTEFTSSITFIKSIEGAIKFDKEISVLISDLLMKMREQNDAEKALLFFRILLLLSNSTSQTIVGRQRHIDKDKERLRQA